MNAGKRLAQLAFRKLPRVVKQSLANHFQKAGIDRRYEQSLLGIRRNSSQITRICSERLLPENYSKSRSGELRHELRCLLGLEENESKFQLLATVRGESKFSSTRMQRLLFRSGEGLGVTANFYLPNKGLKPFPCVIYLCGHWPSPFGAKVGFQDRYLWYPENGFALLVVDPLGFGEIPGIHHGLQSLGFWDWISKGYSPAAPEVMVAMRLISWLKENEEVDDSRIGVTGISGGGVITQYLAALDERVAVAAASCSTYTIADQVCGGLVPSQCDCTFIPNILGLDFPEILSLIAPRPFLILGGRKDPIFPPSGFRQAFESTRRVYDALTYENNSERIRLVESNQGHTDPKAFLVETRKWMTTWLSVKGCDPLDECSQPLEPSRLRVLDSESEGFLNAQLAECWFGNISWESHCEKMGMEERRDEVIQNLNQTSFKWFPCVETPPSDRRIHGSGGLASEYAQFAAFEIETEPDIWIRLEEIWPQGVIRGRPLPLLFVLRSRSLSDGSADIEELIPYFSHYRVVMVWPRFCERILDASERSAVERMALLTGRSIMSMQIWDLLQAIRWANKNRKCTQRVSVYGADNLGSCAVFAAILNPKIGKVITRDLQIELASKWPLLFANRFTNIQEVIRLLHPTKVYLIGPECPLSKPVSDYSTITNIHRASSLQLAMVD